MMTIPRSEFATRDLPEMPPEELESEWLKAKADFDQARLQKQESDRAYVAAANRLNMLDRLAKKVEQRAALDRRAAAKFLVEAAKAGATNVSTSEAARISR